MILGIVIVVVVLVLAAAGFGARPVREWILTRGAGATTPQHPSPRDPRTPPEA